jgi:hypothetical protein
MDESSARALPHCLDLPSLLATSAARQAVTPTARMQASLTAQQNRPAPSISDTKSAGRFSLGEENSQSFNGLARKVLNERAPKKALR